MYITVENRKKLQEVLENALCETMPDNALFDEEMQKNFYLLLLSLIYELNGRDTFARYGNDEEPCFCQRLQEVLISFSVLKESEIFDANHIQQVTVLANDLENLSMQVNRILLLLNREYTERLLATVPDDVAKQ